MITLDGAHWGILITLQRSSLGNLNYPATKKSGN